MLLEDRCRNTYGCWKTMLLEVSETWRNSGLKDLEMLLEHGEMRSRGYQDLELNEGFRVPDTTVAF